MSFCVAFWISNVSSTPAWSTARELLYKVRRGVSLREVADFSILREAQKELGAHREVLRRQM